MGRTGEKQESINGNFEPESHPTPATSTPAKPKMVLESERAWLNQRERAPARYNFQNFCKGSITAFTTPGKKSMLNLTPLPSTSFTQGQASGAQTPRGDSSRQTSQRASARYLTPRPQSARAVDASTGHPAQQGSRRGIRSGSMSERLGCPIRPGGGSAVRRPDGFTRKAAEKKAKTDSTSHLWNLCRILQCLRFCEMQWGFVNAHVEKRIHDYKQMAEQELSEAVMATYGLQNRLSQLKEEKAQWESLERSEEVIQVLGPALKSLHKNKGPFMSKWKPFRAGLLSSLEDIPVGSGVSLGGYTSEDGLEQVAKHMRCIVHTLDQMQDMVMGHNGQHNIQQLSTNDRSPSRSSQSNLDYIVQSGGAAKRFAEAVAKHAKVAMEVHALVADNTRMKVAMASMRMQYSQMLQLT